MITRDPKNNNEYHPIDISQHKYDVIQKIAYKMNVSTRTVADTLINVSTNHLNECAKALNKSAHKIHHPYEYSPYTNN